MWNKITETIERIDQLSSQAKFIIFVAVIVVICGVYWHYFWGPKQKEIRVLKVQIQRDEKLLNEYRLIAQELPEFERQFKLLTAQFEAASRRLPTQKEIPGLIDSIYGAVNETGLEPSTFTPKGEIKRDIYAEIPVQMKVFGTYRALSKFFDRVSRLSRIVNITDLQLQRPGKRSRNAVLQASFTALTFRILPQQEIESKGAGSHRHGRR